MQLRIDGLIINFLKQEFWLSYFSAERDNILMPQFIPFYLVKRKHPAQLRGHERQERLERDNDVTANLQGDIQDCPDTFHIGLGDLPRLGLLKVSIADSCDFHRVFQRLAEMEVLKIILQ